MIRYAHTNLIAKDVRRLIDFYKTALDCRSIGETRDLSGEWLDRLTGIPNAHLFGEHLALPGYEGHGPTLEIFSYDRVAGSPTMLVNAAGFAHLAFEVDDVAAALNRVLTSGGGQIGELVQKTYADGRTICVVYATDPEGNILELQGWS
jgi:catechol 2,3-dioxygenase-like lactoylglutathione lyase family enzyme